MIEALNQTYSTIVNEELMDLRKEIDSNTKKYQLTIST